jgi:hypothetical protein
MTKSARLSRLKYLVSVRERRLLVLFFVLLLSVVPPAFSQSPTEIDTTLGGIKSLYDDGSYVSAELQARRMLEERHLSDSARVQLEKYVAFSLVAQGRNDAAVDHFKEALKVDSTLTLDPILTSPKILGVFETAKGQFETELEGNRSQAALGTSMKAASPQHQNRGPTFRAILFPGWEQSFRGETVKGHILLGAGTITGLSSIAFDILRRDAKASYLDASTPDLASSRYRTYNYYYKSEFYSASAFILIYIYSGIDSFVNLPPNLDLDYSPGPSAMNISLRIHF